CLVTWIYFPVAVISIEKIIKDKEISHYLVQKRISVVLVQLIPTLCTRSTRVDISSHL
ncbi:unnamed protein product, partial [Larinioides sclopetarius]